MSVQLGRYIIRMIRGKLTPIRIGIKQASAQVNNLVNKALSAPVSRITGEPAKKALLGRGVDFNVFTDGEKVLKLQRLKRGTSSGSILKKYPQLKDKAALSKTVADNLPNYGVQTLETEIIRVNKGQLGLIQPKIQTGHDKNIQTTFENWKRNLSHTQREAENLRARTGLHLDAHSANIDIHGNMIDTGLNLKKVGIKRLENSDTAKEIIGIENNFGTTIKQSLHPEVLSDQALLSGVSKKALRKINSLAKKKKINLNNQSGLDKINKILEKLRKNK